jgi:hypothetical protein
LINKQILKCYDDWLDMVRLPAFALVPPFAMDSDYPVFFPSDNSSFNAELYNGTSLMYESIDFQSPLISTSVQECPPASGSKGKA